MTDLIDRIAVSTITDLLLHKMDNLERSCSL